MHSAQRTEHYTRDARANTPSKLRPFPNSSTIANSPTRVGPDAGENKILKIAFSPPCPLSSGRDLVSAPYYTHETGHHMGDSRSAPPADPPAYPLTNTLNSRQDAGEISSPAINNSTPSYSHGNPADAEPNHTTGATHDLDLLAGGNRNYMLGTPTASPSAIQLPSANAPPPENPPPGIRLPKGTFDSSPEGKLAVAEELTRSCTFLRKPCRETGEPLRTSPPNSLPCLPTKILATTHIPVGIPSTRYSKILENS
ncbi:hypothetical protein R1flu_004084 [Riccia fluitans]|uniref:Uncharacterized protein n=1 Tax=Riccia fluitans TaxID=41844 RepID=A0ABD1YQ38_9MARC